MNGYEAEKHGYEFWELLQGTGPYSPCLRGEQIPVRCSGGSPEALDTHAEFLPATNMEGYEFIRFAHVAPDGQVTLMDRPAEPAENFSGKEFSCKAKAIEFLKKKKSWWLQATHVIVKALPAEEE